MFLQNFHIFINKRAMLLKKFTVQVTTLSDCDDITRFDGIHLFDLEVLTEQETESFSPPDHFLGIDF